MQIFDDEVNTAQYMKPQESENNGPTFYYICISSINRVVIFNYCSDYCHTLCWIFFCVKTPHIFNTLTSGWFWQFSQKNQQFSVALPMPELLHRLR